MSKTKLQEIFRFGFTNIAAGMFFCMGYVIVEHATNSWWPAEDTAEVESSPHHKVAANNTND